MNHTPSRRWILLCAAPPAFLTLWFFTAPAVPAVQRIIAGGPSGGFSRFLSNAAEAYEAPIYCLCRTRPLNSAANALGDFWWRVLAPPDKTP
jgi:hypothetical protein